MGATRTTTKISSRGQVVLPAAVREAHNWGAGTELEVISKDGEVVLRKRSRREELYPPITLEEFFARIPRYEGPYITDEMMHDAIEEEARRRWNEKNSS